MMMMLVDTKLTGQRVHSGATMDDYMLNLTIPSKSTSTW
jgi:hypothetical protein